MNSKTDENLALGFTDESETHMRYLEGRWRDVRS